MMTTVMIITRAEWTPQRGVPTNPSFSQIRSRTERH
jgi:hypothetical protein